MHSVSIISKFMSKPSKLHYAAAKRVLRYLQGTKAHGLLYEKEDDTKLAGFTDSDWDDSVG